MKIRSARDIVERYRNETGIPDIQVVFIDIGTDDFLGYSCDGDYEEVLFVNKENDYKKIWKMFPNAVRLGNGDESPYDKGLMGYVEDGNGNARFVYEENLCCEGLCDSEGIDIADAYDDWSYNTLRSLPYVEEVNRPYVMSAIF